MRYNAMKRFGLVAAIFVMAGVAGACADEPMAPSDDVYEVQLTEEDDEAVKAADNCIVIDGQTHCKS